MDSTIFRYSHGFYNFSKLFRKIFGYSHGFYLFPVLARILSFFGTYPDSTIFRYSFGQFFCTSTDSTFSRYSFGQFFGTRTESTFFRYSPVFYHFPILTRIPPFFSTRSDIFSVLARNLHFSGTCPDSIIFPY